MEPVKLKELLEQKGISLAALLAQNSPLFVDLAKNWERSLVFQRRMNSLLIDGQGADLTPAANACLRELAREQEAHRLAMIPHAPTPVLKALGEDRVALIERDQMPLTAVLSQRLKEAHQKISKDDLSALVLLRDFSIDLNQKDRDGLTLLALAAQHGSERCLFGLCKNGANPHVPDSMGNGSLHWACAMDKKRAASILLFHGANPNAVNHIGATPLMLSLSRGDLELSQKLLDYGADLRMKDRKGNTALHRVIVSRNKDAIRFMLDCGASLEETNGDGVSGLGMAMRMPELTSFIEPYRREIMRETYAR